MSVTINVVDHPDVRVTEEDVEAVPPDAVEFAVEGTATISGGLLEAFEGRSLRPVAVAMSVEDSSVVVDLDGEGALRLESVDVGVETPGVDDLPSGADGLRSAANGIPEASDVGAIAFAVEGIIAGIEPETFDALTGSPATIESITFAVDEPLRGDGGTGDDVVFEVTLFGHNVVIRRDGTMTIRKR